MIFINELDYLQDSEKVDMPFSFSNLNGKSKHFVAIVLYKFNGILRYRKRGKGKLQIKGSEEYPSLRVHKTPSNTKIALKITFLSYGRTETFLGEGKRMRDLNFVN